MISLDDFLGTSPSLFTSHQIWIIDKVSMVSCGLGMLGSLFMVVTYILFKEIRGEFSSKIICLLSLSDFMASLLWFPFTHTQRPYCLALSVGLQFFLSASFFWTLAISVSLLYAFYSNRFEHLMLKLRYYNLICWGIPFFFVILTTLFGKYTNYGVWCFIATDSLFRLLYYIPLVVVFLINSTVFIAVRVQMARHRQSIDSRMNVIVSFYLVAFLVSQLPAVVNGFQHYVISPDKPVFVLYVIIAALQPLQGFLNGLVYGFNEGFMAQYIYFMEKHCGRRLRKGEHYERDGVDTENLLTEYNYHSDDEN